VTLTEIGDNLLVQLALVGRRATDIDVRVGNDAVIISHHLPDGHRSGAPVERRQAAHIVGSSPGLHSCLDLARQAAADDGSVLLTGEAGTGKELFARFIHEHSRRAGRNFVVVDCAAIAPDLLADLLSDQEPAGIGQDAAPAGLLHQARYGTLFLDEVSELPLVLQQAFLRRWRRPLPDRSGAGDTASHFRLLAATRCPLAEAVKTGRFCRDFLKSLHAWTIDLPPLRDRTEDLGALCRHFIDVTCRQHHLPGKQMTPEFLLNITHYGWPGNVRELSNVLEQAIFNAPAETTLFPKHLPVNVRVQATKALWQARHAGAPLNQVRHSCLPRLQDMREKVFSRAEQHYLSNLITLTGRNIEQACELSGLSRSRLYTLLKKHQITTH
jgi:two-component system NtrC family response regulator